ncbi:MAG: chorismate mutase [Spirochaetales bacterium]|nr:chorismate mutase [Spirochaetales bacterium]
MITAVRGATTVDNDTKQEIIDRVVEMVDKLFNDNNLINFPVVSIHFSITEDLISINPAAALRKCGNYSDIPLFCCQEPKSVDSLKKAIRVLITWDGDGSIKKPCYLHGAKILRPDLIN